MKTISILQGLKLRVDQLWLAVILAAFAFYASLVPIPPNDFWWHLKIGEIIQTQRFIPTTNLFAWSLPAEYPMVYGAWLAELIFFLLYKIGKLELLIFIRNFLAVFTFGLVGFESYKRSGSWRISALVTACACLMVLNNLPLRPQIWSWLPFVFYLFLLRRYVQNKINRNWLLILPLIMIFWTNVHGAFILGIVLIGIFFIGMIFQNWDKLKSTNLINNISWLGVIGVLTAAATIINPRSFQIFSYVLDLMTDAPSQRLVEEWQSPTPSGISNTIFFISILLLIAVFSITRHKHSVIDLLLIMAFLWLAWNGQRYVVWYAIVSMPILAEALKNIPTPTQNLKVTRAWINSILALVIFIPVFLVQPWYVEKFPLPETYWSQVHKGIEFGPLLSISTPVDAGEYLKSDPGGSLFNEMGYGSYLIWAVPEQKVFVDPRVELYPYEQWQDYLKISRSIMYPELLEKYQINRILLDNKIQENLSLALSKDQNWKIEYEDEYSQIWSNK